MMHMCGWSESQDPDGNVYTSLAALTDPALYTSGDDLRIPQGMERVLCAAALRTAAANSVGHRVRLTSPYLLRRQPYIITPMGKGGSFGSPAEVVRLFTTPLMLRAQENVRAQVYGPSPSSAQRDSVLIWIADTDPQPLRGDYMSVIATAVATVSGEVGTWANKALTFAQELPFGDYRIGGMRVEGANIIAARLALPGYTWRPGTIASGEAEIGIEQLRNGMAGEMGRFNTNQPPSLDVLCSSAGTALVHLDLLPM